MCFTESTFTVEVNGTAMIVFQAKWHGRAEEICHAWSQQNSKRLSSRGRHGSELPPLIRLRIARLPERSAYDADGESAELCDDVRIVYLLDLTATH
jgi:hypothetical protein